MPAASRQPASPPSLTQPSLDQLQHAAPDQPPAPARLTQSERRARSEHNLMTAAVALIDSEGVAAATLERIGLRAGYSRGLATQKYGSKQGLIEALIAALQTQLEEVVSRQISATPNGLAAVCAFASVFLSELASDGAVRAYFMLMAASVADRTPTAPLFAASHEVVRLRLQVLIEHGQQDGSIDASLNAADTALLIGSQLLGLAVQHLIDPATAPERLASQTSLLIARQLRPER